MEEQNQPLAQEKEETTSSTEIDTSKDSKHYLSSGEFFDAIMESRMQGKISDKLAMMFVLLSERNVNHRNFVRYHHIRQDLIQVGQLACVTAFKSFRPFKSKEDSDKWEENQCVIDYHHEHCSNSFAYFTTCIRNAIIQFLKTEYNESNVVNKTRLESGLDASYGYVDMVSEREAREAEEAEENESEMIHDGIEGMQLWDDYDSGDSSVVEHSNDELGAEEHH